MMGKHDEQKELFSYHINLDKRVRADHLLRAIAEKVDFTFVRYEVQRFYGKKGNVSVDPVIICMEGAWRRATASCVATAGQDWPTKRAQTKRRAHGPRTAQPQSR